MRTNQTKQEVGCKNIKTKMKSTNKKYNAKLTYEFENIKKKQKHDLHALVMPSLLEVGPV